MFGRLVEIALNSALKNLEIKERVRIGMKIKVNLLKQENIQNKIIDLDKNNYEVLE